MKKVEVTRWEASDGTLYETEDECLKHEKVLEKTRAFEIAYEVDLTEGRGMTRTTILVIPGAGYYGQVWAEAWCEHEIGRRVEFVQGTIPTFTWKIREIPVSDIGLLSRDGRVPVVTLTSMDLEDLRG